MKYLVLLSMFFVGFGCQPIVVLAAPGTLQKAHGEKKVKRKSATKSSLREETASVDLSDEQAARAALVKKACSLLSRRKPVVKGKAFRADCSGFIEAVSYGVGIDIKKNVSLADFKGSGVDLIREYLKTSGDLDLETPVVGDLIFFSDTYDKNRDGKLNDALTHIGIIESIEQDGTIHYIHHSNGRVRKGVANMFSPDIFKDEDDKILNSYLRRRLSRDRKATAYMSGGLAVGFGSFFAPREVPKSELKTVLNADLPPESSSQVTLPSKN